MPTRTEADKHRATRFFVPLQSRCRGGGTPQKQRGVEGPGSSTTLSAENNNSAVAPEGSLRSQREALVCFKGKPGCQCCRYRAEVRGARLPCRSAGGRDARTPGPSVAPTLPVEYLLGHSPLGCPSPRRARLFGNRYKKIKPMQKTHSQDQDVKLSYGKRQGRQPSLTARQAESPPVHVQAWGSCSPPSKPSSRRPVAPTCWPALEWALLPGPAVLGCAHRRQTASVGLSPLPRPP